MGRLMITLGCVAIVAGCNGLERLLHAPWVYPVDLVNYVAALLALGNLIGVILGPRIMPMDDDDPRPWDVG